MKRLTDELKQQLHATVYLYAEKQEKSKSWVENDAVKITRIMTLTVWRKEWRSNKNGKEAVVERAVIYQQRPCVETYSYEC